MALLARCRSSASSHSLASGKASAGAHGIRRSQVRILPGVPEFMQLRVGFRSLLRRVTTPCRDGVPLSCQMARRRPWVSWPGRAPPWPRCRPHRRSGRAGEDDERTARQQSHIEPVSEVGSGGVGAVFCSCMSCCGYAGAGAVLGGFAARRVIWMMAAHWTMAAWWAGSLS